MDSVRRSCEILSVKNVAILILRLARTDRETDDGSRLEDLRCIILFIVFHWRRGQSDEDLTMNE